MFKLISILSSALFKPFCFLFCHFYLFHTNSYIGVPSFSSKVTFGCKEVFGEQWLFWSAEWALNLHLSCCSQFLSGFQGNPLHSHIWSTLSEIILTLGKVPDTCCDALEASLVVVEGTRPISQTSTVREIRRKEASDEARLKTFPFQGSIAVMSWKAMN